MSRYLNGGFPGNVRNKKVHSYVFTVYEAVDNVSDLLRQPLAVQIEVVLCNRQENVRWCVKVAPKSLPYVRKLHQ